MASSLIISLPNYICNIASPISHTIAVVSQKQIASPFQVLPPTRVAIIFHITNYYNTFATFPTVNTHLLQFLRKCKREVRQTGRQLVNPSSHAAPLRRKEIIS